MNKLLTKLTTFEFNLPLPIQSLPRATHLDRKAFMSVLLILLCVSAGAWYLYYQQGLTLSYNDARSHLNVARRVVDSLQPGAASLYDSVSPCVDEFFYLGWWFCYRYWPKASV